MPISMCAFFPLYTTYYTCYSYILFTVFWCGFLLFEFPWKKLCTGKIVWALLFDNNVTITYHIDVDSPSRLGNFTSLCEGRSAFFLLMGKFGMCDLYAPTWGRMHQLEGESWVDYNKHMKVHWEFTIIRNSSISSHCIILSEWFTLIVNVMTCFLSIHIALLRLCVVPINFEGKCKRNK